MLLHLPLQLLKPFPMPTRLSIRSLPPPPPGGAIIKSFSLGRSTIPFQEPTESTESRCVRGVNQGQPLLCPLAKRTWSHSLLIGYFDVEPIPAYDESQLLRATTHPG